MMFCFFGGNFGDAYRTSTSCLRLASTKYFYDPARVRRRKCHPGMISSYHAMIATAWYRARIHACNSNSKEVCVRLNNSL